MADLMETGRRKACGGGHPHEALVEAMALFDKDRARRLAWQIWWCPEAVSASCCIWLRLPLGITYGELAQHIRRGGF